MSLARLQEHRRIWSAKPLLRDVYGVWFDALLSEMPRARRILELGAGPGLFSEYARERRPELRWVASDILPAPWNELTVDGLRLPFREGAFDAVVALDVLHHVARPADFFAETARVLGPGGRLAAVEPWVTPFSYPIYRWLHQEGCRLSLDPWDPFGSGDEQAKDAFEGDAAVVWRLVRTADPARWRELGLAPPRARTMNGFAYLASLGFKPLSIVPRSVGRALLAVDRVAAPLSPWLGLRTLVVWDRTERP